MTALIRTILRRTARALASSPVVTICVGIHLGCLACILPGPRAGIASLLSGRGAVPAAAPALRAEPGDDSSRLAELTVRAVQLCHDTKWSQQSVDAMDRYLRSTGALGPITGELLRRADTIPPHARAVLFRTIARRSLAAREISSTDPAPSPHGKIVPRRLDITF